MFVIVICKESKMKLGLSSKQFVLAFFALFISCILSACGSGTSSSSGSSGNSAAPVALVYCPTVQHCILQLIIFQLVM